MTLKTNGIVLLKRDFRESDRIYTVYTEEFGKLELLGKATRKIISKLGSHLEPPALVELFIIRGKIFDHIANARKINSYNLIRQDFDRILEFSKVAKIFDQEVKLEQKDPNLYKKLLEFLNNLDGNSDIKTKSMSFVQTLTDWTSYGILR